MTRHEYWKHASDAFRDGRVDEYTYDAMIMNMDIFCDDEDDEEEEEEPLDFVRDVFYGSRVTPEIMTVEQAQADLTHFVLEGWKVPSDLDADTYADLWNDLVEEMNEDEL